MTRPLPTKLAIWGFLLVALSYVVAAAAGNLTGAVGAFPPFAVLAVGMALLIWATGRFYVPGLAIGAFLILVFGAFGGVQVIHPESFADFIPVVLRVLGSALATVGCAVAWRQRRRGSLRPSSVAERRAVIVGAIVLALVAAGSAALTYTGSKTVDVGGREAVVVVTEGDEFIPSEVRIKREETMLVLVRNRDSYAHTFSIDELAVDEYIAPRAEHLIRLPAAAVSGGKVAFDCAIIGHEGMTGTILAS